MGSSTKLSKSELLRVMARFGEVSFRLAYLDKRTYGLWQPGGKITINIIPDMVDSIVHEILHELHQDWSEKKIRTATRRIIKQMSDDEMVTIAREFMARAEKD